MAVFSLVHKGYNNNSQKLSLLYKERRDRNKDLQNSGLSSSYFYEQCCNYSSRVCSIALMALVGLIGAKAIMDKVVIRPENDKY